LFVEIDAQIGVPDFRFLGTERTCRAPQAMSVFKWKFGRTHQIIGIYEYAL